MPVKKSETNHNQLIKIGILAGVAQALFCLLMTYLVFTMEKLMGQMTNALQFTLFLLLVVIGVAITGVIVFGYPALLFMSKKIKEAVLIIISTLITLIIIIVLLIAVISLILGIF
jgi:hypothetical protein